MTVLHLVPSVAAAAGGMANMTVAMSKAQRDIGIEASIWCGDRADVAAAADEGIHVSALTVLGPRRFAYSPGGERRARAAPADVVHQHGLWTAQARITQAFRARGVPTVVAPHGCLAAYALRRSRWKKRAAFGWYERRNLRDASCLHATSEAEVGMFRQFGLRAPVAIVHNGIERSWLDSHGDGDRFRRQQGIESASRVMLFLARVHPIKGLPMLLDAVARHGDELRDWTVVIAGPDEVGHLAEVRRRAGQLGIAASVVFVGALFGQDKRDAFAAADLFVLPTYTENFGIVVAEALACGVPAITTQGAPWEELEQSRSGWWVRPDSRSIGEALVDAAARTPSELRAMGQRGRSLVESRYLWPAIAARTHALYRWLRGKAERPDFVVVD